ncbi:MAG: substrate-binding domain-containing protein [Candidatus Omnitrophota bacterium]
MKNKKRNQTFALVVPRFEDIFHSFYAGEIIKGVGLAASRLKVDILMHITDRFDHHEWMDSAMMDEDYVDGIIFADINNDVTMLRRVINKGMPYVVLNNTFVEPINCISIDNKKAAIQVVEYLIRMGHKNIATIAGDLSTQAGKQRLEGYKEALTLHGIKLMEEYLTTGDFLRTPARKSAEKLLKLKNRPTAIFAASDVMALEVIDEARAQKIKVPEELSVVGFDDNPLNVYSPIKLSTVAQPLVEMGRLGVEQLGQIIARTVKIPLKTTLGTKFMERDSTAVLPNADFNK